MRWCRIKTLGFVFYYRLSDDNPQRNGNAVGSASFLFVMPERTDSWIQVRVQSAFRNEEQTCSVHHEGTWMFLLACPVLSPTMDDAISVAKIRDVSRFTTQSLVPVRRYRIRVCGRRAYSPVELDVFRIGIHFAADHRRFAWRQSVRRLNFHLAHRRV